MITVDQFREMALSLPDTIDAPHFDRTAFKVVNRRIFATLHEKSGTINIKLSPVDQSVFCSYKKGGVYAVPNKWGLQGWTTFELKNVPRELLFDALNTAYSDVMKVRKRKKGKSP